ncbi:MAG: UDP-2,3-diacylglucosamine diphosphatase [Sideroxydans sp.]|nr:UDP-2,3-diacylglucosamine diphosphatase [Sideroxydans sp.]
MPHSLFISDLHLSETHPRTTEQFLRFLENVAPQAEALYILGDLFEYWAGDDDLDTPFHRRICEALATLPASCKLHIMHGNRDLLMADAFAATCKASLLSDPTLINLYGQATLLTHGDTLCTEDHAYLQFRAMVHNPEWQAQFLAQPLYQRKAIIGQMLLQSSQSKQSKQMEIMDVSNDAVLELLRQYEFPRLIHGHTHRPAMHIHHADGHTCERWVLGDWDTQANALQIDETGIQQLKLS